MSNLTVKSVIDGGTAVLDVVKQTAEDPDGLGPFSELCQSLLAIPRIADSTHKFVGKALKTLGALSGFLTVVTIVEDVLKFAVPDDNGKYLINKNPLKVTEKSFWTVAHWIDFITWLKASNIITSETKVIDVLSVICSALKVGACGVSIFLSIKSIDKNLIKADNYKISKRRWTVLHNKSGNLKAWKFAADKKIDRWTSKQRLRMIELGTTSKAVAAKDDRFKHCEIKIKDWTTLNQAIDCNKGISTFPKELEAYAKKRITKCDVGVNIQKQMIIKHAISIILSAAIIASIGLTIGLRISGNNNAFGLSMASIGVAVIALPIVTNSLELTNFVVGLFFSKDKLGKKLLRHQVPVPTQEYLDDLHLKNRHRATARA